MREELLHYIWQQRLLPLTPLTTTMGQTLEVISVGTINTDAGADFFNAKIKIDGVLWAGDVEIHLSSSDWNSHRHHLNPAYNNVILHVVAHCDTEVYDSNGRLLPQFILPVPSSLHQRYSAFIQTPHAIPCQDSLSHLSPLTISSFLSSLAVERMMRKSADISALLSANGNDWSQAFYQVIARSFGFGKNGDAMQLLAHSLPLSYIAKHRDNLLQIEALLFGQAGLLPTTSTDSYTQSLISEYQFLSSKFSLTPISSFLWKMARLRPHNFPQIRLAQFASLLHTSSHLFSKILETPDLATLRSMFSLSVSPYWQTHYTFGQVSRPSSHLLTTHSIDLIIINTILPFLFAYGNSRSDEQYSTRAFTLLEQIPAESNAIVSYYSYHGFKVTSAADSQALIQLRTTYCDKKDCLRCRIGHEILRK